VSLLRAMAGSAAVRLPLRVWPTSIGAAVARFSHSDFLDRSLRASHVLALVRPLAAFPVRYAPRGPMRSASQVVALVAFSSVARVVRAGVIPLCLGTLLAVALGGCGNDAISGPGSLDSAGDASAKADAAVEVEVVVEVTPACPGLAGCACTKDADCPGSACVPSAEARLCAAPCPGTSCGAGLVCKATPTSAGEKKLCHPRLATLCQPCLASAACKTLADTSAACVAVTGDLGASGWSCTPSCSTNTDCPSAYSCTTVPLVEGGSAKHCVPDDGACFCNPAAVAAGAKTSCFHAGVGLAGKKVACYGQRACAKNGLTPCDATVPVTEVCDGLDNDCTGGKDDGPVCDDKNACTLDTCTPGKGCGHSDTSAACKDGNPCTDDACDGQKGCTYQPNSLPCDDGQFCTKDDTCAAGACKAKPLCDDGNPCTEDVCKTDKPCSFVNHKQPCDDAEACTKNDACFLGKCEGKPLVCNGAEVCKAGVCQAP